ncbi:hypothetical protein [Lentzea aerocolonigenes]|uniref:hypothetical protein n=1 Tax=Lentzea aerocolonigenes TaxID=68170 RepID=UPI000AE90616|nr:hypothetical protein [Lentzea aerocolonigenes]
MLTRSQKRLDLMVVVIVLDGARSRFTAPASLPPTVRAHADGDQPDNVAMAVCWWRAG